MGPQSRAAELPSCRLCDDEGGRIAVQLLALGLRRALNRPHGGNESLHREEGLLAVALGDQAGISADVPTEGNKETA